MQIKNTLRYDLTPVRMAKINKIVTHPGKDVGKGGHLFTASGKANVCSHYGNQCGSSSER